MDVRVTVQRSDSNELVTERILSQNGDYIVTVHNGRFVKVAQISRPVTVQEMLNSAELTVQKTE